MDLFPNSPNPYKGPDNLWYFYTEDESYYGPYSSEEIAGELLWRYCEHFLGGNPDGPRMDKMVTEDIM